MHAAWKQTTLMTFFMFVPTRKTHCSFTLRAASHKKRIFITRLLIKLLIIISHSINLQKTNQRIKLVTPFQSSKEYFHLIQFIVHKETSRDETID